MSLQANGSMPLTIRPAEQPQPAGKTSGVERRSDSGTATGFSPRTDLSIQTAVDDMAGILAKISTSSTDAVEQMPEDLQKVIDNVMKQAFSFDETLGKGLGSSIESQRFSMDQLSSMARMLFQLSNLAEKGYTTDVSDTLSTLLTNLKEMVGQETGQSLEPVLLAKAAFALIDNMPEESLSPELSQLMASLQMQGGSTMNLTQGSGQSPLSFLNKLVDFFVPRPSADASSMTEGQTQQGGTAQPGNTSSATQQAGQTTAAQQGAATRQSAQTNGQPANANAQTLQNGSNTQSAAGRQMASALGAQTAGNGQGQTVLTHAQGQTQGSSTTAQPQSQASQNTSQGQGAQTSLAGQSQTAEGQQSTASQQTGQPTNGAQTETLPNGQAKTQQAGNAQQGSSGQQGQTAQQGQSGSAAQGRAGAMNGTVAQPEAQSLQKAPAGQQRASQTETEAQNLQQAQQGQNTSAAQKSPTDNRQTLYTAMQQAKEAMMNEPMKNTPQMMQSLKDLAQLLMKDQQLSPNETTMLQDFVNGKNNILSEKDARQLQLLIKVCQQNVPATVQQAAIQMKMPDLPRLWAFMQLCDMTNTRKMSASQLKKAGKDLAIFVQSMRGSMEGDNASTQGTRSLNFMLPLFFGQMEQSYPSYIQVYDENQRDKVTGEMKKETWLRICMLTGSIGAVELVSRVFNEDQLDMRVFFSDHEAADAFRSNLQDVRKSLRGTSLKLHDFEVNAAGERRFV